jgi:hypothetical protein
VERRLFEVLTFDTDVEEEIEAAGPEHGAVCYAMWLEIGVEFDDARFVVVCGTVIASECPGERY